MKNNQQNPGYWLIITVLTLITGIQSAQALFISEIMYNPVDQQLEYIELYNHRAVFEDLSGYAFANGIEYTFAPGTTLGAKEYLVIALDPNALQEAYGISHVLGPYNGKLDNGGERIDLNNGNGGTILSVRYSDTHPWPIAPDGTGHSLVIESISDDPDDGSAWRASTLIGGTPGTAHVDFGSQGIKLWINELLASQSSTTREDWLELYNAGPSAIDLSDVYLSDDASNLLKYKLPDNLQIQSGGFWATDLSSGSADQAFALKASGEAVFVTLGSNEATPAPRQVLDAVRFDALAPDVTFGRFPDGSDNLALLRTASKTQANAHPLIHDIVINEIMYHHGLREERYEYIELYNRGTQTLSLEDWAFTDGIDYVFPAGTTLAPEAYLVIAKDLNLLKSLYTNLAQDSSVLGPYNGTLNNYSERIRLSYPLRTLDPNTGESIIHLITADEVTYYDGGRWPTWADGQGTSLELRDPHGENNTARAWAASEESEKSSWVPFSFTVNSNDSDYSHDRVSVFDMMLLNQGEVLLDDLQLTINGQQRLENSGFEDGLSSWRILGNHVQSLVTSDTGQTGSHCLKLIATGHGDPGANRINQSINSVSGGTVTFSGRAKWLRGSRYLLMRASRDRSPTQPPRPSRSFELEMPLNQGTPGLRNTAYIPNRGPDICDVQHTPILPKANESIVVTARITDVDGIQTVALEYRSEGASQFSYTGMVDNGQGKDQVGADGIYTGVIPPAGSGTMRAFRIHASDGSAAALFPTALPASTDVADRTCLVRINDTAVDSEFARYRIWLSNDVISTFQSRPNLSNELMDCTFVYNETNVFYNTKIRLRGSPFLRGGFGLNPVNGRGLRIKFNSDQRFGRRTEINLDNTEQHQGSSRGPLQERASFWFYRQMGLPYSRQEFVRPVLNGQNHGKYEDVQKIDGDYIQVWFPDDTNGYIHKVDDYFEYNVEGTSSRNYDEGLKYDSDHPLSPETYRWGFEKRSHRDSDNWDHLFKFAMAMNVSSKDAGYEEAIESVIDPEYFARVLAIRHAVGDWDSYGFERGKNNYFYYAAQADKWYLLPWDIDFTMGSGRGTSENLFSINSGKFPEVRQFLSYPKYEAMYRDAYSELVSGSWKTSYGTEDLPTPFDLFLDDAADALMADGEGDGRRDGIKQYVRARRNYILTQVPTIEFHATVDGGDTAITADETITIEGVAPMDVVALNINGQIVSLVFTGKFTFEVDVAVPMGASFLSIQGLDQRGFPVADAKGTLIVIRLEACSLASITPASASNQPGTHALTLTGDHFTPGSDTSVTFTLGSNEIGFDAQYVQHNQAFDRIDAATLLLNDVTDSNDTYYATHAWINLSNGPGQGEFGNNELDFASPFDHDGTNYAVRFSGFILVPSPGVRYFGVNSDDGFSLRIDDQLVGEYADARGPATTDVIQNKTAGTMSLNFPQAGRYPVVIDFFENGGGEAIEFFQTDALGGDLRLINVDAELSVVRALTQEIEATEVLVETEQTMTCQIDLTDAEPGLWNVTITPPVGLTIGCEVKEFFEVVAF